MYLCWEKKIRVLILLSLILGTFNTSFVCMFGSVLTMVFGHSSHWQGIWDKCFVQCMNLVWSKYLSYTSLLPWHEFSMSYIFSQTFLSIVSLYVAVFMIFQKTAMTTSPDLIIRYLMLWQFQADHTSYTIRSSSVISGVLFCSAEISTFLLIYPLQNPANDLNGFSYVLKMIYSWVE